MFFIVGRGRSGTTLLAQLLGRQPQVFVAPESLFVMNVMERHRTTAWKGERELRRFARDVFREDRMRRWRLSVERLSELLRAAPPPPSLARLCAMVYQASAEAHGVAGARRLGDKNPHYALFVRELAALFPQARFLHLVRDYRDNVVSYREVPFDLSSVAALSYRWRRYNQEVLRSASLLPERFLRIRFESLVRSPEPWLQEICRFLGVSYSPAMLTSRSRREEASESWHRRLALPVDDAQVGVWRSGLRPGEVALADRICQPLGASLGYLVEPPSSPGRVPAAQPGLALGWAATVAERLLFRLPLPARVAIIRAYRAASR
jgi:hypothetical protein